LASFFSFSPILADFGKFFTHKSTHSILKILYLDPTIPSKVSAELLNVFSVTEETDKGIIAMLLSLLHGYTS